MNRVHVALEKNIKIAMVVSDTTPRLTVAVAVIKNAQGEVLITKRAKSGPYGDLWEFPGGKIETGETPKLAVIREIKEELDITCQDPLPWLVHYHQYPDCHVALHVFFIEQYKGNIVCLANQQDYRWVNPKTLSQYDFPEGNVFLIQQLDDLL